MSETGTQSFFDMITTNIIKDFKADSICVWVASGALVVIGIGGAISSSGTKALDFIWLVFIGIISLIMHSSNNSKVNKIIAGDKSLSFVHVFGTKELKFKIIRKLNQAYQDGQVYFEQNKNKNRVFLFPDYVVFVNDNLLYIIARDKLHWTYISKGSKGRNRIHFIMANEEIKLVFKHRGKDANEIVKQLKKNYGIYNEFDKSMRRLYEKDRAEFIRQMNDFKNNKKVPV